MIAAQFETNPIGNWNEGLREDYDPSFSNSVSFVFSADEIPAHSQLGMGNGFNSTSTNYFNFQYSTGNIPKQTIVGLNNGISYHIHRDENLHYANHDPESTGPGDDPVWNNTLTVDRVGGKYFSWAFSPTNPTRVYRGYSFLGERTYTSETYPWTIWVR